jgi:hypothetical protein
MCQEARQRPCGFIVGEDWRYGGASPFCDAPAVAGSSYCERHRVLCELAPDTPAGVAAALALEAGAGPEPPPELGFLAPAPIPELDAGAEPEEIAACLELGPRGRQELDGDPGAEGGR